jgi:hypothetical protein
MSIKLIISKYKIDIIFLSIIILISLILRLYQIDSIPTNITGDESWDLGNIYRIIFDNKISPLTFLGDGANSAIIFYPVAILIKIFGLSYSVFFLRLNIIFYSILSLIVFYFILKKYSSAFISFLVTLMLSANYIFLNFSRTAWVNMLIVFSSLSLIYFLEKAINEKKYIYYLIAGIFGGLGFYVYHFGKIFFAVALTYLLIKIILEKINKDIIKGTIIFLISSVLVLIPFFFSISNDQGKSILTRPSSTFAFSKNNLESQSNTSNKLITHQLINTFKGFVLLDGSVMSEGIENSRYTPYRISPVNIFIQILFITGLIFIFIKKKFLIWWVLIFYILLTQVLTVFPPNYARGLLFIPIIYFVIGLFIFWLIKIFKEKTYISTNTMYFIFTVFTTFIIFIDINTYFSWMKKSYEYNARQPAIDYVEFPKWQEYQIKIINEGGFPVTNYTWYEIRKTIK